ncbi:MAG: type II toxin-antitoxin system HicA family toxin [Methanothrix sp.]|nr:type II toxin-antitoxin system HicA family toxin [Methanothrix sp.]MDD4446058.1 type II toxin-antitoxin system HicA family toxin [Methanothrix sp.]
MCKIVPVPYRVLIKKLKKLGLEGPHHGRKHPYMIIGDTLPNPHQGEDVDVNLIKTILNDAGISRADWISA